MRQLLFYWFQKVDWYLKNKRSGNLLGYLIKLEFKFFDNIKLFFLIDKHYYYNISFHTKLHFLL